MPIPANPAFLITGGLTDTEPVERGSVAVGVSRMDVEDGEEEQEEVDESEILRHAVSTGMYGN